MEKRFVYTVMIEYLPTGEKALWEEAFSTASEAMKFIVDKYDCIMDGYVGIPQNGDKNRYVVKPLYVEDNQDTKEDKITPTVKRLLAAYRRNLSTYDEVHSELYGYLNALKEYGVISEEIKTETMNSFLCDVHEVSVKRNPLL